MDARDEHGAAAELPLPALASQLLVAFTIEFDNEFEQRMPHRTTRHGSTAAPGEPAPWLVSMAMWTNCMRFVPSEGTTVRELRRSAWWLTAKGSATILRRMGRWWRYLTVSPARGPKAARADWLIRPTPGGRRAQEIWTPLTAEIESRWRERFGTAAVDRLSGRLAALGAPLDPTLPDCLPAFDFELHGARHAQPRADSAGASAALPALLARTLLAFAGELEAVTPIPAEIGSNVLRVLGADPQRVRDLPALTGAAKEAVALELSILGRGQLALVGSSPDGGRSKVASLTPRGVDARGAYLAAVERVEADWRQRFGGQAVDAVRDSLASVLGDTAALDAGFGRYPDGWRAALPRPQTLPHFPIISHRGGFPDGS